MTKDEYDRTKGQNAVFEKLYGEQKSDELNERCAKVIDAISDIPSKREQIEILEQVIDYIRMDIAQRNTFTELFGG